MNSSLRSGTAAVGVGGYWWFDDGQCIDRREPTWTLDGRYWSPPVTDGYCTYASEGYGFTGTESTHRIASLSNHDGDPNRVFTEVGAGGGVPLVTDGTVYVGTGQDRVYALDQRSGHVEWRYDAGGAETYGGGAWGQPVKVDGIVVAGVSHASSLDPHPNDGDAFTHRVVALDAESGEEVWSESVDGKVWTGPVAVGDTVVAATEAGNVHGFAVGGGTERWRGTVGTEVRESIFADESAVHVASRDGQVVALDPDSGAKQWTSSLPGTVRATERDAKRLFVGTDAGTIVAFARSSGRERWRFENEAAIASFSSDGTLTYFLDQRGFVRVREAATGDQRDWFRVAENVGKNNCGWVPRHERGTGLVANENSLAVTGNWVGRVPRYRE